MEVRKSAVGGLVVAEIVSILGSRMTLLALPWFVLATTGSAAKMSVVLAVQMLPMALLGIPSGMLVQRLGARTTMLVADAARAPLLAAVPLLHAAGLLSFPVLLVLVFGLGCFAAPYFASQRVILPELVGENERRMSQANSLIEGGAGVAALAGPALAGFLIPFLGAPNVLYLDAGTYAVAFLLVLLLVPRRAPAVAAAASVGGGGLLAGVRFISRERLLGPLAGAIVVSGFFVAGLSAALPVYAYGAFGSPRVAGLLYAALGAGALVGALVAMVAVRRVRPLRLAACAILAFAVPLWVLPFRPAAVVAAAALFVASFFAPLVNGPVFGVLTSRTPAALRAKVMTAVIAVNTLAAPAGFLIAGQMLDRWGVGPVFAAVAGGMTLTAVLMASVVLLRGRAETVEAPAAAAA